MIEDKGEGCRQQAAVQECVVCWCWSLLAHVRAVTFPLNHKIRVWVKKKNMEGSDSIKNLRTQLYISICEYYFESEGNWCQNLLVTCIIKGTDQNWTVKLKKRKGRKKNLAVFIFFSFLCLLFCIVMAIFPQCSPPSVGMWYLSIAEWKRGGGRKWCSLIPESLTSNHANLVHFEANPAPTICRVKTTIYYACIAPSLW